jgi:hypothetical protein
VTAQYKFRLASAVLAMHSSDAQLFGKGIRRRADRTRDFVPPLPSFGGN